MFWYYLQSRTNKALLISKNRRPFRWGEDVYILYFLCVSVLSVYPKVLAVRKTEMCGSSARNWQRHLSGCWKGLISFRCPGTVHLLIKQKNCSDFSCLFSLPQTAAHSYSSQLGLHTGRFLAIPDPTVCEKDQSSTWLNILLMML